MADVICNRQFFLNSFSLVCTKLPQGELMIKKPNDLYVYRQTKFLNVQWEPALDREVERTINLKIDSEYHNVFSNLLKHCLSEKELLYVN